MWEKRRANNYIITGLATSIVVVLTGGAFIFFTHNISQSPSSPRGNHTQSPEQLTLVAASSSSSLNQLAKVHDWTSYQHVDFPLTYKYPRNWVHEEAVLKGIWPKTFQIYPAEGSLPIIYITFLDPGSYASLDEVQATQEIVQQFHGSFSRISLNNGVDALDETYTKSQWRGGPWTARIVSILYNGTVVDFELRLEYDVSSQDEQAARAIFDNLLNSIVLH